MYALFVNENNEPLWIRFDYTNLLNNKEILEKCLWKFERKSMGGSIKSSQKDNNCIIS